MKIIVVDDEKIALDGMVSAIKKAVPDSEIHKFSKSEDAARFAENNKFEIAFLDIEMRGMNGIELAEILKKNNPSVNIIFATGYNTYSIDAFRLHASGYITKPVTAEKISEEMLYLRSPVECTAVKKLKVQCFGNFEIFHEGKPLKFSRSKTKELFAYLVDRKGASVNTEQICAVLWDGRDDTPRLRNQVRNLVCDLRSTLKAVGSDDVFVASRNSFSVDTELIDCDYYRFLDGENEVIYSGEYMSQYSWAEMRLGSLMMNKKSD